MLKTESPWILNLQRDRDEVRISNNESTDVIVIGGGVSGMMVAYFLLQDTDKHVILLEKNKVSHGASGHNAGQAVAAFEIPYDELIRRYGYDLTNATYAAVHDAFDTLHNISKYAGVEVVDTEALASFLNIDSAKERLRTPGSTRMYVPTDMEVEGAVPIENFNEKVWSQQYAAAVGYKAGILNCPVFLERLAKRLLNEYEDRFVIYEHSKADEINTYNNNVEVKSNNYSIHGETVVICTNGYPIPPINTENMNYHVQPVAGYLIGRFGEESDTSVRSYLPADAYSPYYYITRRSMKNGSLTCIGGLDTRMKNWQDIESWTDEDDRICSTIEAFLLQDLIGFSGPRNYQWKGLMGYTDNNVRIAGRDPISPEIYYSIGCNGIGILPSVVSGEIICNQIAGVEAKATFFEPSVQRPDTVGNPAAIQLLSPPSKE